MVWVIWIVIAVVALVGEVLTTGLFLASVALAAFATAALSLAVPLGIQLGAFALLSLLLLGAVRPAVLGLLPTSTTGQEPPRVGPVGQQALAIERIDRRQGVIRVGSGEFWTARPIEPGLIIEPGSDVEVVRMDGLTARVQPTLQPEAIAGDVREERESELSVAPTTEGGTRPAEPNPFGLTGREVEVLQLVALGISNQEIADRLYLSPRTVHHHVSHIFNKMGAGNRVEAVRMAMECGLVSAPPSPHDQAG